MRTLRIVLLALLMVLAYNWTFSLINLLPQRDCPYPAKCIPYDGTGLVHEN